MLQVSGRTLLASLTMLSSSYGELRFLIDLSNKQAAFTVDLPIETRAMIVKAIQDLQAECQLHKLKTSEKMAQMAFDTCVDALAGSCWFHPKNLQRAVSSIEGLLNAVIFEAEDRQFFMLDKDAGSRITSSPNVAEMKIINAFPQLEFDLTEAGKCLSFGLWTACVMHTMRMLEVGLNALANHLSVTPSENWNKTLNEIEQALRMISKKTDGALAEQWAAEAGTHLRFIKNAWRNHAMHQSSKYDENDANRIFNEAKSFLEQIEVSAEN